MLHPGIMALAAGLAAQVAKVPVELVLRRRWRPLAVLENGGMPSSHTATVTTLTLAVQRAEGWDSSIFSLVLVFSFFVILEATGLRQEIGHQAQILNEMMDRALAGGGVDRKRLRELVGHTWTEVAGGLAFGVLFTLIWWRLE
ncbi:MAG: divergent PAP2 family protein [bacterium]|nr:divergent PAP2 family protein [bacterium]